MAVVQFGLAMSLEAPMAEALISGTTSGMRSMYRNAEELSTTMGPAAAIFSACSRAKSPETARKTKSHLPAASTENSSTATSLRANRDEGVSRGRGGSPEGRGDELASAACGGEEVQRGDGEAAAVQDGDQLGAHRPRGAHDADRELPGEGTHVAEWRTRLNREQ